MRTQDQIGEGGKGEGGGGLPIEMYEKTDAVRVKGEFIFIVAVLIKYLYNFNRRPIVYHIPDLYLLSYVLLKYVPAVLLERLSS